jgi:hypothetical protein
MLRKIRLTVREIEYGRLCTFPAGLKYFRGGIVGRLRAAGKFTISGIKSDYFVPVAAINA